jgi:hypothetical protein
MLAGMPHWLLSDRRASTLADSMKPGRHLVHRRQMPPADRGPLWASQYHPPRASSAAVVMSRSVVICNPKGKSEKLVYQSAGDTSPQQAAKLNKRNVCRRGAHRNIGYERLRPALLTAPARLPNDRAAAAMQRRPSAPEWGTCCQLDKDRNDRTFQSSGWRSFQRLHHRTLRRRVCLWLGSNFRTVGSRRKNQVVQDSE